MSDLDDKLSELIHDLRAYVNNEPYVWRSHHYTFAYTKDARAGGIVVMGMNPGETAAEAENMATKPRRLAIGPSEESAIHDFREGRPANPATKRWRAYLDDLTGGVPRIETKRFFFSTPTTASVAERYDSQKRRREVYDICDGFNKKLIHVADPALVLVVGRSLRHEAQTAFGLTPEMEYEQGGSTIAHSYQDVRNGRSWLFVSHPNERAYGEGAVRRRTKQLAKIVKRFTKEN